MVKTITHLVRSAQEETRTEYHPKVQSGRNEPPPQSLAERIRDETYYKENGDCVLLVEKILFKVSLTFVKILL